MALKVAVVAHKRKSLDGGLPELRRRLADAGVVEPLWYEVPKSRKAPKRVRKALDAGAELIFVWGGDGMVQRTVDALARAGAGDVPLAIVPAGTANLLATNLGIPEDLAAAVEIGLNGRRRTIDLGRVNGEHFAVMAGAGFDGELIRDADGGLKDRLGRVAYAWTGVKHVRDGAVPMTVTVDGEPWYAGTASCVLFGNVGTITGGIRAFDDASPHDGKLEVGVATAEGALQWARTLGRMATGRSEGSPFIKMTAGQKIRVKLAEPLTYEIDGGARGSAGKLKVRAVPAAVTLCLPAGGASA
ncbi:diacylglycerol kinase [Asanoa ishikariensis]|uniref:Lipid kinase, YegS/Rv2252/BmrU family n=1 Tax=Asanoa ishikariensis TaxID=137265 RepID=A0A1H3LKU2_9ACTN|nr:diacylglycerol kinase family protein [Asanoa ishikariensis]GIF65522.1 diacylglycerol kinase [Asanoa ishikariensis]SDY64475.1 lipid kinase, YegS/Rv2252/BmrU family [Asanoa ishikariensis]